MDKCQCGEELKVKDSMFYWRGVSFSGLVCEKCNSLFDNPEDSFMQYVEENKMKIPHCDKCGCRIDKDLYNITFQDDKKLMPPIIGEVCSQCFNAVIKQMQHSSVVCNSEKTKEDLPKIIEFDPKIIDLGDVNFIVDYIVSIDGLPNPPDDGTSVLVRLEGRTYLSICVFTCGLWRQLKPLNVGEFRIVSRHSLNIMDFKDNVRHSTMPLNEGSYRFDLPSDGTSWLVLNGNLIQHGTIDLHGISDVYGPLTRKELKGFSTIKTLA